MRKARTTRAFFLELVLDLVIFGICAVISLMVFAEARTESLRSAALSQLGLEAQKIAEQFRSGNEGTAALAALPNAQKEGDSVIWYYDRDLTPTTDSEAYFTLTCAIDETASLRKAFITLDEGTMQLLSYEVSDYIPSATSPPGGDGS
jgi:Tfp pilus assembly protein PilE